MTGAKEKAEADELIASGKVTQNEPEVLDCGKYAGMTTLEARKAILEDLEKGGYIKEIEPLKHDVGTCYRCKTTIEPMVSKQWFVRMEPLAGPAMESVEKGEIRFVPDRFKKNYMSWMRGTRDWCISRQLWWGHRIPAWYCDDCGETIVSKTDVTSCPKCGGTNLTQDPDTLDTWFSSALWPFSTLGWPDETEDLKHYFPTNTLVTGYDIIGFWVSRMIFSSLAYTGKPPFDTVLIHGLVRDALGRKMSKSLGNGIDPLEIIDKYGADALRFTLVTGNSPGNDMRFSWDRVEANRNFANKIWNASRFILMNLPEEGVKKPKETSLHDADKWILSRANKLTRVVTENMDKYEIGMAADRLYEFIWDELCDWYIEMVKPRLYGEDEESKHAALYTLRTVLMTSLKLLHPYMPFVTEAIYGSLQPLAADLYPEESIMISAWPVYDETMDYEEAERRTQMIMEAVRGIRNVRSGMNVPLSRKSKVYVVSESEEIREIFEHGRVFFATLGKASEVMIQKNTEGIAKDALSVQLAGATIYIPLEDLVDIDKEIERLEKEKIRLEGELKRVDGMLSNERFLSKAPESKIREEQEKKEKYAGMMAQVESQLASLRRS